MTKKIERQTEELKRRKTRSIKISRNFLIPHSTKKKKKKKKKKKNQTKNKNQTQ